MKSEIINEIINSINHNSLFFQTLKASPFRFLFVYPFLGRVELGNSQNKCVTLAQLSLSCSNESLEQ